MLYYITNFLADGRLVKIGGPDQAQYIPLLHQPDLVEYDIIVDEMPNTPNIKEQVWGTLMSMMPFLKGMAIPPSFYGEVMKYSPLPATLVSKLQSIMAAEKPPPSPDMIKAQADAEIAQARVGLMGAQADRLKTEAQLAGTRVQGEQARTELDGKRLLFDALSQQADVEVKKSTAILNLAKAGETQQGSRIDQVMAILDMLSAGLATPQAQHDAQMDRAAASAPGPLGGPQPQPLPPMPGQVGPHGPVPQGGAQGGLPIPPGGGSPQGPQGGQMPMGMGVPPQGGSMPQSGGGSSPIAPGPIGTPPAPIPAVPQPTPFDGMGQGPDLIPHPFKPGVFLRRQ